MTLSVSDGELTSAVQFSVTVKLVDEPPTIQPIDDQLTVRAFNLPPAITAPAGFSLDEETEQAVAGISVTDPDAAQGELKVQLRTTAGGLILGTTNGLAILSNDTETNLVSTGTIQRINDALGALRYRAAPMFVGRDEIAILVDDQGNTGFGGPKTDAAGIKVTVKPVDQPPTISPIPDQLLLLGQAIQDDAGGKLHGRDRESARNCLERSGAVDCGGAAPHDGAALGPARLGWRLGSLSRPSQRNQAAQLPMEVQRPGFGRRDKAKP